MQRIVKENEKLAGAISQKSPALTVDTALVCYVSLCWAVTDSVANFTLLGGNNFVGRKEDRGQDAHHSAFPSWTWAVLGRKWTFKALNCFGNSFLIFLYPWNSYQGTDIPMSFHRHVEFKGVQKLSLMNLSFSVEE